MEQVMEIRDRWINYNRGLIDRFVRYMADSGKIGNGAKEDYEKKLSFFAIDFLLDFESEIEEDPDNEDGGIITLDTVYAGYIDGFLGRWLIQKSDQATEENIRKFQQILGEFYGYMKENKLYREGSAQYDKLRRRLENPKKYMKRLSDYMKIQELKDDEEEYLDQLREWEYEDLF